MADYHSPTVVTPFIPSADMTSLERLILGLAFDEETGDDDQIYFHSWCGPSDIVAIEVEPLRQAHSASKDAQSIINDHVAARLAEHDAAADRVPHDYIELDLSATELGWERMLQDILRRSSTIDEIVVTAAFTCSRMRPDGFGGSVTRITAGDIRYQSTTDMLNDMRGASSLPPAADAGQDTRRRIEAIAGSCGWDAFTLLLLIARWADQHGHSPALVDHLSHVASSEDD